MLNLIGKQLGRFEVLAEIGRGGMGIVYQARQHELDRIVALKVLPPEMSYDTSYIARFRQEAKNAARLEHPHIVPVYDVGEAGGEDSSLPTLHYIAMKYIAGSTLKDILHQAGQLELDQSSAIIQQVGTALAYAHRQGILHRDIKPSNIMLTPDGWVYLTDFGTARDIRSTADLTKAGTVIGTPEYMAPEQAQGVATIGTPADVYALGVVLYEMLTGEIPFEADTPMGMLAARLIESPRSLRQTRPDVSPLVEEVIMRALVRDPIERYQTVDELLIALDTAIGSTAPASSDALRTLVLDTADVPHALPAHATSGAKHWHSGKAGQGPAAKNPSFVASLAIFRTPIGLLTAVLILFLLIGGWFRLTSNPPTPTPTPTPTITRVTPTLPPPTFAGGNSQQQQLDSAWLAFEQGQYSEAKELFQAVLAKDSSSVEALVGMGWILHAEQSYTAAENHFQQAIELDPSYGNAYFGLGSALEGLGRDDDAAAAYEQALEIDGPDETIQQALERVRMR
jgi:serine/threonine-protein kinase